MVSATAPMPSGVWGFFVYGARMLLGDVFHEGSGGLRIACGAVIGVDIQTAFLDGTLQ